jgi:hypothetical protein
MEGRPEPEWLDDRWTEATLTVTPAFGFSAS